MKRTLYIFDGRTVEEIRGIRASKLSLSFISQSIIESSLVVTMDAKNRRNLLKTFIVQLLLLLVFLLYWLWNQLTHLLMISIRFFWFEKLFKN